MKNHGAGDVAGLEEVFRSQHRSRLAGPALDTPVTPERPLRPAPSAGGAVTGAALMAFSADSSWRRETSRSWTFASMSALVALVAAGLTASAVQHRPVLGSAQGQHAAVRPHDGFHTSGAASTGPTAGGPLSGTVGSGVLALGQPPVGATASDNQPHGQVALNGAATTSGAAVASPAGSAAGAPPLWSGATPVAAGVGNAVGSAGSSAAGFVSEVGSANQATAPATTAVTGVVNTAEQTVRDSTL